MTDIEEFENFDDVDSTTVEVRPDDFDESMRTDDEVGDE